ncbi:MAG: hypothetical protein MR902_05610 [Campylobacter sp.]|nr:hypothetical protein [Campylobacter sp.]
MQNSEFLNDLKSSEKSLSTIQNLAFKHSKKAFDGLSETEKSKLCKELFEAFFEVLKELNLATKPNIKSVLMGIKIALTKDDEDKFMELVERRYKILHEISTLRNSIKNSIFQSFEPIEKWAKDDLNKNENLLLVLNEFLLDATYLKDMFKEVCESTLIVIVESGVSVKDTTKEVAKNLVYYSVSESEFNKTAILDICRILITEAVVIATESKIYAKELISGAILGADEGVQKSVNEFKDRIKFAPDEMAKMIANTEDDLLNIQNDFVNLLKEISFGASEPAKSIVEEIIKKEYDNYIVKMKRLSNDTAEQIRIKLEDMHINENYKEFSRLVSQKLEEFKNDLSDRSTKFKENFELEDRISKLKKEIVDLEKSLVEKFTNFRQKNDTKKDNNAQKTAQRSIDAAKQNLENQKEDN